VDRPQPSGIRVRDAIKWARSVYEPDAANGAPPTMLTVSGGGGIRTMSGRSASLHVNGTEGTLPPKAKGHRGTRWYSVAPAGVRCLAVFVSRWCPDRRQRSNAASRGFDRRGSLVPITCGSSIVPEGYRQPDRGGCRCLPWRTKFSNSPAKKRLRCP
jgi:hypothetical protein